MKTPEQLRNEFWKADIKNGGYIFSQYQEVKSILKNQDLKRVNEQLLAIKKHAISQTDFYKSFSENDVFPVMNKMSLIENYDAHLAKEGFMKPLHVSSTSGSTGTPFSVVQDFKKRKRTIADIKVFGEFCDYPSHERMIFFRVINDKLHRTPEQEESENIYYIDSSDLSKKHIGEMVYAIIEKKPRIVFSYSSTLVEIAKYIKMHKISSDKFGVKSILTGGEGLSEENRILLQNAFGGVVYRRYSDMELGILGQDLGDGGKYILNWGSYYFECLKINSDEPAEYGEVGRIVITDLFNYAFPMIRYDTGDLGIMEKSDDTNFPYLKEIFGRIRDCVYTTNGKMISPAKVSVSMWGESGIKQWQFIQETQNEYVLKLNTEKETDITAILEKFKKLLGNDAKIKVEYVNEIPVQASNKRRAVICNYKKRND